MKKNFKPLCLVLSALMMVSILINLNTGFVDLSFSDFWLGSPLYQEIADLRINRTLAVLLAGVSIPTSGFLLQEYFKNPLAGPSVLGITSVAGLFVAFYLLASQNIPVPEFLQNGFISLSAVSGALLLMIFLVFLSHFFRDGAVWCGHQHLAVLRRKRVPARLSSLVFWRKYPAGKAAAVYFSPAHLLGTCPYL